VFGCYAQYYRKAFTLKEKPIKATIKLSALGIFVAHINGKKVSKEYFAPGWTNYSKTLLYREYDITSLLETNNAISLCVGDGWYAGFLSIRGRFRYGNYPLAMFAEMTITFADGSTQKIVSDDSWKAGLGAIRENDFLGGEIYDSRLLHSEISLPDFDDSSWDNVFYTEDHSSKLMKIDYVHRLRKKWK
jgi:alpha-L-rhamnosidase